MDNVLAHLLGMVLKLALLVAGLVVFLSLLAAALVLAALWGLRALWARLTGKPVTPWVMGLDPRGAWRTAGRKKWRAPGMAQEGSAADDARPAPPAHSGGAGPLLRPLPGTEEVTDVQARPSVGSAEPRA